MRASTTSSRTRDTPACFAAATHASTSAVAFAGLPGTKGSIASSPKDGSPSPTTVRRSPSRRRRVLNRKSGPRSASAAPVEITFMLLAGTIGRAPSSSWSAAPVAMSVTVTATLSPGSPLLATASRMAVESWARTASGTAARGAAGAGCAGAAAGAVAARPAVTCAAGPRAGGAVSVRCTAADGAFAAGGVAALRAPTKRTTEKDAAASSTAMAGERIVRRSMSARGRMIVSTIRPRALGKPGPAPGPLPPHGPQRRRRRARMPLTPSRASAPGDGIWLNSWRMNDAVENPFSVAAKNFRSLLTSKAR